jgi:hypothetical protein
MSKKKFPTPQAPRSVDEINKEYTTLAQKLGANAFSLKSIQTQNDNILNRIAELQEEMGRSQALANQVKENEAPDETV